MSKHTPGPWQFYADVPSTDPNWHIVTNASRMRVLANVHIEPGNETDLANAKLITAAPELLEAAQSALVVLQYSGDEHSRLAEQLSAAIDKATK